MKKNEVSHLGRETQSVDFRTVVYGLFGQELCQLYPEKLQYSR